MRPTVPLIVSSLLVGAFVDTAQADPLGVAMKLARFDQPGGSGAPVPAPTTPAATEIATASLFGELTGPAENAALPALLAQMIQTVPSLAQARIDQEIAELEIARAQTWREWTVDASLRGAIRGGVQADTREVVLDGTLARRLFTGGTFGISAASAYERSARTTEVELDPVGMPGVFTSIEQVQKGYTESITATYSQPLLRGRGDLELLASERAARINRDAAAIARDIEVLSVVQGMVLAYFDLTLAERQLAIRRASLDLTRERLRVTQAGITAGGTARAELIAVEQSIATREEEILGGELTLIEQSLAIRRQAGMPVSPGQMLLATSVELAIPEKTWNPQALLDAALANSPELARLRTLEAGASIEVEVTEHGVLPSLDLAASFGPSGSGDNPGRAAVNMAKFDDFTATVALTYRSSLGQGAAKAVAREARARRVLVQVNAEDIRRQIGLAITRATVQVIAAERRHAIATRAVSLAEQNLVAEQARLSSGKSRNVDVLQRQDELRAAQLRVAGAIVDWHRAATIISTLTGELLPQYGVSVQ